MLLLFLRVLSELFFYGLAGKAGRANSMEFVTEYTNDFGRHGMVQDCDALLNFSLIVLRDCTLSQVFSSSTTNLLHICDEFSCTHGLSPFYFVELAVERTNV